MCSNDLNHVIEQCVCLLDLGYPQGDDDNNISLTALFRCLGFVHAWQCHVDYSLSMLIAVIPIDKLAIVVRLARLASYFPSVRAQHYKNESRSEEF